MARAEATVKVDLANLEPVKAFVADVAEVKDHAKARAQAETEGDSSYGEMANVAELLEDGLETFAQRLIHHQERHEEDPGG